MNNILTLHPENDAFDQYLREQLLMRKKHILRAVQLQAGLALFSISCVRDLARQKFINRTVTGYPWELTQKGKQWLIENMEPWDL